MVLLQALAEGQHTEQRLPEGDFLVVSAHSIMSFLRDNVEIGGSTEESDGGLFVVLAHLFDNAIAGNRELNVQSTIQISVVSNGNGGIIFQRGQPRSNLGGIGQQVGTSVVEHFLAVGVDFLVAVVRESQRTARVLGKANKSLPDVGEVDIEGDDVSTMRQKEQEGTHGRGGSKKNKSMVRKIKPLVGVLDSFTNSLSSTLLNGAVLHPNIQLVQQRLSRKNGLIITVSVIRTRGARALTLASTVGDLHLRVLGLLQFSLDVGGAVVVLLGVVHGLSQRSGLLITDELKDVVSRAKTVLGNGNSVFLGSQTSSNQLQKVAVVTETPVPFLLDLGRELGVDLAERSSEDFLVGLGGSSFLSLGVGNRPHQTSRLPGGLASVGSVSVGSLSLSEHVHDHVRSTEGVQGQDDQRDTVSEGVFDGQTGERVPEREDLTTKKREGRNEYLFLVLLFFCILLYSFVLICIILY